MRLLYLAPLIGILVSFTSCASVSVRQPQRTAYEPAAKIPEKIYVRNFKTSPGVFRVDRSGDALAKVESDLENRLSGGLVERLTKYIAPAEVLAPEKRAPRSNAWVVTGKFDRVNQGSRALRAFVGLGAGGTKVETTVEVYDVSGPTPKKFLTFQTTGGSNAQQGLITTLDPFGGPVIALGQAVGTGLTIDTRRTSRMITGVLCEYLKYRGVKLKHPKGFKPLGSFY